MIQLKCLGKLILFILIILSNLIHSQTINFQSSNLKCDRTVEIFLPKNYDPSKHYSTIYVLDGSNLGNLTYGINNIYTNYDKFIESIIISINQDSSRWIDCSYKNDGDLTIESNKFKLFISEELIPYVEKQYLTTKFRTIIGHSLTANFVNYFLFDNSNLFSAYICISPYFSDNTIYKIKNSLSDNIIHTFYYLSYSEFDLKDHKISVKKAMSKLKSVKNQKSEIFFDVINNKTHITMLPTSIENSLFFINKYYTPINSLRINRKTNYFNLYTNYYAKINEIYKISKKPRFEDTELIMNYIINYNPINDWKKFGDYCIINLPTEYVGNYCLGYYHLKNKNYEFALKNFEIGYKLINNNILNKEDFYEIISKTKEKINKM